MLLVEMAREGRETQPIKATRGLTDHLTIERPYSPPLSSYSRVSLVGRWCQQAKVEESLKRF